MKNRLLSIILVIAMLLAFASCSSTNDNQASGNATKEPAGTSAQLPTEDRAGNKITVPEKINSIISLAPAITETLVALGLGDSIIAIDTNSVGLDGVKADIPAFDLMNPDAEQLANLNPSIIMVSGISMVNGEDPFKPITDLGICVACIPTSSSIQAIREDISFIAQVTKTEDKSKEIISEMDAEIEKIQNIGKTIKDEDKKTVYFEIAAAPYIYSFGSGVFLNEMIEIIGAKNVFADQKDWISVEAEVAINTNPDVILTNVNYIEKPCDEILSRSGWENMDAIKNKQVFYIDNFSSSLANQNIVKALKEMAKAVYPELY